MVLKKIHDFSKIPIAMVLISCCKKWHNNHKIRIETFLKTIDSIQDDFNFVDEW